MYSSFQRRLVTLENVFDREMKSECIQTYYVTCLAIERLFDRFEKN